MRRRAAAPVSGHRLRGFTPSQSSVCVRDRELRLLQISASATIVVVVRQNVDLAPSHRCRNRDDGQNDGTPTQDGTLHLTPPMLMAWASDHASRTNT
jgi:hypothetical protein